MPSQPTLRYENTDWYGKKSPSRIAARASKTRSVEVQGEQEGDELDSDLEYSSDDSPFARLNSCDAVFGGEINSDSRR